MVVSGGGAATIGACFTTFMSRTRTTSVACGGTIGGTPSGPNASASATSTVLVWPTDMPRTAVVILSPQGREDADVAWALLPVRVTTTLSARTEPRAYDTETRMQRLPRQVVPVKKASPVALMAAITSSVLLSWSSSVAPGRAS